MNRIQLVKGYNFPYVLVIASFLLSQSAHSQTIVINEFMSSNDTTLADEDGDFSDWIELYNSTVNPVNLEGYHPSDDETLPQKWTFLQLPFSPVVLYLCGLPEKIKWTQGRHCIPTLASVRSVK
ncbi:MAG: hypothetical protein R2759_11085 [Bacteroidales bacterium]